MAALPAPPAISDARLNGRETTAFQRSGTAMLHSFNCSAAPAPPPPPALLPPLPRSGARMPIMSHNLCPVQVRAAAGMKVMAYKVTLQTPEGDKVRMCCLAAGNSSARPAAWRLSTQTAGWLCP